MNDLVEIIRLMTTSPLHENYRAKTMTRVVLPCIEQKLYRVEPGKWFCTFAYWNAWQISQFMHGEYIEGEWTDRPDTLLWIIDLVIAPELDRNAVVRQLVRERLWRETDRDGIAFARSYGMKEFQRIGKIKRAA